MTNPSDTAEALFIYECQRRGISCSKPFSQSLPYDVVIDHNRSLKKIQIKSTVSRKDNRVQLRQGRTNKKRYDKRDIDFFACYSFAIDEWMIIPSSTSNATVTFSKANKLKYKSWDRLMN